MTDRPLLARSPMLGVAYYPEYLLDERVHDDMALMAAAGIGLIRVGESVWSTWEPQDGVFDTTWLTPTLDAAHDAGIHVILGTPTYAVPPWLMRAHPDIQGRDQRGMRIPWGARQEADIHHPVFRRYAERIIRRVVTDVGGHPAVIGYQVDNEPGEHLLFSDALFRDFRERLIARYGGVAELNAAWNLTHWSHRLTTVDDLWPPDGNHVPQYDLEWRRFQQERTAEYIEWQATIVRGLAREEQFVTTCVDRDRPGVDERALGRAVEVAGANLYLATQEAAGPLTGASPLFPASGDWAARYGADRARALTGGSFLVSETNATSVGFPWHTFPSFDGQWRLFAWTFVARGAAVVSYWNWHTMHASWESQWHGVLPHTFEPGRTYREIARVGIELREAAPWASSLAPEATVGVLFSTDTKRLWEFQPLVARPDGSPRQQPGDPTAYEELVFRWYGGLAHAGHGLRFLHPGDVVVADPAELVAASPVLAIPAVAVADDALVHALHSYVQAGGHLVLGARSLVCDGDGRFRDTDVLRTLCGGAWSATDYTSLRRPLAVEGRVRGPVTGLLELLDVGHDAEVIGSCDSPFGERPVVVSAEVGAGRVTYVAGFGSAELLQSIGEWVRAVTPSCEDTWPGERPAPVQVHGARDGEGGRTWFVMNPSAQERTVQLRRPLVDRASGAAVESVTLGAWDVAMLRDDL